MAQVLWNFSKLFQKYLYQEISVKSNFNKTGYVFRQFFLFTIIKGTTLGNMFQIKDECDDDF